MPSPLGENTFAKTTGGFTNEAVTEVIAEQPAAVVILI
jgi:hypothetical protein